MEEEPSLVGYARTKNGKLKISLNTMALEHATRHPTSTDVSYMELELDLERLMRVIAGTRAVTTVTTTQIKKEEEE